MLSTTAAELIIVYLAVDALSPSHPNAMPERISSAKYGRLTTASSRSAFQPGAD
jgi:hypothetical protein